MVQSRPTRLPKTTPSTSLKLVEPTARPPTTLPDFLGLDVDLSLLFLDTTLVSLADLFSFLVFLFLDEGAGEDMGDKSATSMGAEPLELEVRPLYSDPYTVNDWLMEKLRASRVVQRSELCIRSVVHRLL